MSRIRLAVVGAGKLGGYHANLAAKLDEFELVAIADPFPGPRDTLAAKAGARAVADIDEALAEIDAAVVATPTATHADVVSRLLEAGKHVLVEKPITPTAAEATRLVNAAERARLVLQVGHVERFSPALLAARDALANPRYLRTERTSGYTFRSTDIGAVLDLMIHDIDLVLSLARSEVVEVWAMGLSVLGGHEDMVTARLRFASGCVADLTASRVSYELRRTMQAVTSHGFVTLDFATGKATTIKPCEDVLAGRFDGEALTPQRKAELFAGKMFEEVLVKSQQEAPPVNAIELELRDFARAIQTGTAPRVSGSAGRDAVAVAERILASVARNAAPASVRWAA